MSKYSKGAKFERDVIKYLEKKGMYCIRSAGSKGIADIIAFKRYMNKTFVYLIQCKFGNASMSKKDKELLMNVAYKHGFIPLYIHRKKHERQLKIDNLLLEKSNAK